MSTSKKQPLVFPSIKVGAFPESTSQRAKLAQPLAAPPPQPQPPQAQPPQAQPAVEPTDLVAEGRSLSPAPMDNASAPAPFAGIVSPVGPPPPARASSRMPLILAGVVSVLWVGGLVALVVGNLANVGPFQVKAFNAILLAVLALAPLGFIWAAAFAVIQAAALVAEARRSRQLTDQMLGPVALAAAEAGTIVEALRAEIVSASDSAGLAHDRLSALRQALAEETRRLSEAAQVADRSARGLTESLLGERKELSTLAVTLDARAASVSDAIKRQGQMVAEASDLAEVQLREAEASLAARAADMAAAASEANDAARTASDDLARQIARLETAGLGVGDQMRSLEDGLTHQRASLVTVAHALRADQEDFAALAESRTAQLSGFLAGASKDVAALSEVTAMGAQSLSDLIASAGDKFHELAAAAKAERDAFAQSAVGSLNELSEAGDRERKALEEQMRSTIEALSAAAADAREAADVHAEAARARVDQLNEAAFAAGQKADQVFEARLGEARGLIEQSAVLVEEAGAKSAARMVDGVAQARLSLEQVQGLVEETASRTTTQIDQGVNQARASLEQLQGLVESATAKTTAQLDEGLAQTRATLEQLQHMVEDVRAKTAAVPIESAAKADEVRAAFAKGMEDMLATARQASEETQAIDAAFQERVKRNYEMLSEAVQLMGVVAQGGQGASPARRTPPASRIRGVRAASASADDFAEIPIAPEASNGEAGAHERLNLTPSASDEEFEAALEAASASATTPAEAEPGWTWKDLLTSIDGDSAGSDAQLGEALFAEIEGMGIDPAALLSGRRIEEIAAAIQTQDTEGAREVVRALAPAAIRRLSRRLISDREFRQRSETYIARYGAVVAEAARRDKQGFQAASLLNSAVGRTYLLLDAAAGDSA